MRRDGCSSNVAEHIVSFLQVRRPPRPPSLPLSTSSSYFWVIPSRSSRIILQSGCLKRTSTGEGPSQQDCLKEKHWILQLGKGPLRRARRPPRLLGSSRTPDPPPGPEIVFFHF